MKRLTILSSALCFALLFLFAYHFTNSNSPPNTNPQQADALTLAPESPAALETEPDGHNHPGWFEQWFEMKKDKYGRIPKPMYQQWDAHDQRVLATVFDSRASSGQTPIKNVSFLGPDKLGGRTRALLCTDDQETIFAGGVSGGLWRSDDNGSTWVPINDNAINLSVTTIDQSPFDSDVIYYGTGEWAGNSAGVAGDGIFKSTDGGFTFSQLANTAASVNSHFQRVCKIEHAKDDASTVYAGTKNGGCYRSVDAGVTWDPVHSTGRVEDIVTFPDGSVLLAIRSDGLYHSVDGSASSFSKVSDPTLLASMRRIEIDAAVRDPYLVYAGFEGASPVDGFNGFYRSTDGGLSWTAVSIPSCGGAQNSYDLVIGVHPDNPDSIMAGALTMQVSLDGGITWANHRNPHSDYHAFAMFQSNPDSFLVGNDGGVYVLKWADTRPPARDINRGYHTSQFYGGGYAASGSVTIGGLQDNATWKVTDTDQDKCGKNDGGYSYVHQQNPAEAYRCWQGFPSTDGPILLITDFNTANATPGTRINTDVTMNGENYNFINYYQMNLFDSDQLYVRTNQAMWRTLDQGGSWTRLTSGTISGIQSIGLSEEADPVVFFGGTNAKFRRIDDAASSPSVENLDASVPLDVTDDNISCIVVHPEDNSIAYVSFGNNGNDPRVWKVTDALSSSPTWTDISGDPSATGLPEGLPVNFLAVHPVRPDSTFFAATDFGLYYTRDAGVTWCKETDVPNVVIYEAQLRDEDQKLFLFTHGRGVWEVGLKGCTPLDAHPSYFNSLETPFADGWVQSPNDDFNWTRNSGGTPSFNTGPSSAFDGTYYMYTESSLPNNPSKEAWLVSPCFDVSEFTVPKVTWKFHMFGSNMGTLWLDISTNGGASWSGLAIKTGDQGNSWQTNFVNLFGYEGEKYLRFRFRGITGSSFTSDMAIDWFWITDVFPRSSNDVPTELGNALEQAENAAIVYPNPVGDQLNITLPESVKGRVQLELLDLQGKRLLESTVTATGAGIQIPSQHLASGTYLLRIFSKDLQQTVRISKQ